MEVHVTFPSRVVGVDEARSRFGDRVDRVMTYLHRSDPLGDAAANELSEQPAAWASFERALACGVARVPEVGPCARALLEHTENVPAWVDWSTLDRGGELLFRTGPLGGIVLGAKSLVFGYASPAGNKPLVFSGRLREQAARRLNETSRFVQATCAPGGLRPFADGYRIAVKVRLMHARVRHMLRRSGKWDAAAWGAPINQHDMAATTLLFSLVVVDGLRQLGVRMRASEVDDYVQLWRYAGHLLGCDPDLSPASEAEGRRLGELIAATQAAPDDDSRALVRALVESSVDGTRAGERRRHFGYAMSRFLVGDELADQLDIERTSWRFAVGALQRVVRAAERVRVRVPGIDRSAIAGGMKYWDRVVEIGLAGATAEFRPPDALLAA